MIKGYRWYIRLGAWGLCEPHEKTFPTIAQAIIDAIKNKYTWEEIGLSYCEDDDGFIQVIKEIKEPTKTIWIENEWE